MEKKRDIQYKYNKTASHYDIRYSKIQKEKIQFLLNKLSQSKKLNIILTFLDIGCGTAIIYENLYDFLPERLYYFGIDISINMLKQGIETNLQIFKRNRNNISLIVADAENLPFRKNAIDLIISLTVIQNLMVPKRHLDELLKVLKENGIVLISFHKKFFSLDKIEEILNI